MPRSVWKVDKKEPPLIKEIDRTKNKKEKKSGRERRKRIRNKEKAEDIFSTSL